MRLYLLRHAKSSWDDPALDDEERPLAPRGKAACQALSRHFHAVGLDVELVLCSPARRTRETWAGVAASVGGNPQIRYESDVYQASLRDLVRVVRGIDPGVSTALILGHNPGVAELLDYLLGVGVVQHVPTGSFATLELAGGWPELVAGGGELVDFVRPRELT